MEIGFPIHIHVISSGANIGGYIMHYVYITVINQGCIS